MITKTVARNSLWYGLETVFGVSAGVLTSIAIARALGPDRLGPFVYINWLLSISASLGSLGIPAATSKYMAEYLGRGDRKTARAIFFWSLKVQMIAACLITGAALAIVSQTVPLPELPFAVLLTIGCLPGMVNAVPAQANAACEDLAANVPASFVSTVIYVIGVIVVLSHGWGTTGLAAAVLAMQTVDCGIRMVPTIRRMRAFPAGTLAPGVKAKLFEFSGQNVILLLLSIVVWDRSEMLFLQKFSSARQLAYYSVVFNITERLRVLPEIFGSAVSPSIMAQFGRDPVRLNGIVASAIRYLVVIVFPLGAGVAILSGPAVRVIYGSKYVEAIPLLAVAAVLAIPRALLTPITVLLGATGNQQVTVRWTAIFALVNLVLDVLLIRHYEALGAVIANGTTQAAMTIALSARAAQLLGIRFPFAAIRKTCICTIMMVGAVGAVRLLDLPPVTTLLIGVMIGMLALLAMMRAVRCFGPEDKMRFYQMQTRLPVGIRAIINRFGALLLPAS